MKNCIFCKIIKKVENSYTIYEDEKIIVIMDINPINDGHILIIPKKHVESISDLDDDLTSHLFITAKKINKAIKISGIKCEGINYFLSDGKNASQEIMHTHLHIIPRYKGDKFKLRYDNSKIIKTAEKFQENCKIIKEKLS